MPTFPAELKRPPTLTEAMAFLRSNSPPEDPAFSAICATLETELNGMNALRANDVLRTAWQLLASVQLLRMSNKPEPSAIAGLLSSMSTTLREANKFYSARSARIQKETLPS